MAFPEAVTSFSIYRLHNPVVLDHTAACTLGLGKGIQFTGAPSSGCDLYRTTQQLGYQYLLEACCLSRTWIPSAILHHTPINVTFDRCFNLQSVVRKQVGGTYIDAATGTESDDYVLLTVLILGSVINQLGDIARYVALEKAKSICARCLSGLSQC